MRHAGRRTPLCATSPVRCQSEVTHDPLVAMAWGGGEQTDMQIHEEEPKKLPFMCKGSTFVNEIRSAHMRACRTNKICRGAGPSQWGPLTPGSWPWAITGIMLARRVTPLTGEGGPDHKMEWRAMGDDVAEEEDVGPEGRSDVEVTEEGVVARSHFDWVRREWGTLAATSR